MLAVVQSSLILPVSSEQCGKATLARSILPLWHFRGFCYKPAASRKPSLFYQLFLATPVSKCALGVRVRGHAPMAANRLCRVSIIAALGVLCCVLTSGVATAEPPKFRSGKAGKPAKVKPAKRVNYTDLAVGKTIDSITKSHSPSLELPPELKAAKPLQKAPKFKAGDYLQQPVRQAMPRANVTSGKLLLNSDTSGGAPEYAIVDRYGAILRYVAADEQINLDGYVGQTVEVFEDNGSILSADQIGTTVGVPGDENLQTAAFQEELTTPTLADGEEGKEVLMPEPDPSSYGEGVYHDDGGFHDEFGECSDCGSYTCMQRNGCSPGARGILYARAEYLSWRFHGMNIPALVVDAEVVGTDPNTGRTLIDADSVRTIYGDENVLEDERDGVRFTVGMWLDDCGTLGIEGDFIGFDTVRDTFVGGTRGDGEPGDLFIFRPFFNSFDVFDDADPNQIVLPRGPAVEDVDTDLLDGSVTVRVQSTFRTAGIRLRHGLCCVPGCGMGCGDCVGCGSGTGCGSGVGRSGGGPLGRLCDLLNCGTRRTDLLTGVRWARLNESLSVMEDLVVINEEFGADVGTEILVNDYFGTSNDFVGGEIGYTTEWEKERWSLSILSKLALGNNRQRVRISGFTQTTPPGLPSDEPEQGGLLAQVTNIGEEERDEFSVIPEVGFTLGYQLTRKLRLTGGYTLLYWSNVVRPGDQIDPDINSTLIPGNDAAVDLRPGDHPRRDFVRTDFWGQGVNIGGEYRW